ncbi:MAG: hypothetical protein WCW52_11400 [Elusimicrobiales bacterium]
MDKSSKSKKKALIIFLLIFLVIGGGVFTFFVFQGLVDLKGDNKSNFSYSFDVRGAALPIFEYFGLAEREDSKRDEATKGRIEGRGLSLASLDEPQADLSDWMDKGGAGEKGGRSSGSSAASSAATKIPKMAGGLAGPGGGAGGSSKSSEEFSRFGGGPDADNVRISRTGRAGGPGPARGKAAINALGNARSALGEGLRSGSAMTAKSSWDQGFGAGATSARGGDLSYGKAGLVKLDHIKNGEIADLKMLNPGSLKVTEPGKPELDTESEAKAASEGLSDKDVLKSAIGAAGQGISSGIQGAGSGAREDASDSREAPPKEISELATKPQSKGGNYCSEGCSCGQNCTFTDNAPVYAKNPDNSWSVTYRGEQVGPDGKTTYYEDICRLDPSVSPPVALAGVGEGNSPGNITYRGK